MSDDSHEYDEDALEFIEDERVRIAALHATCPKQIWLQIDPEAEQFDGWDAQTWCSDKINETDVRYVLAASRDAEVASLKNELHLISVALDDPRTDLTLTMVEVIAHQRKERAAEIAELVAALERMRVAGGSQEFHIAWELAKDVLTKVSKP